MLIQQSQSYDHAMCSHYQAVQNGERYRHHFGAALPAEPGKVDLWPGYLGSFIRRHPHAEVGDEAVPQREALPGLFGGHHQSWAHLSPQLEVIRQRFPRAIAEAIEATAWWDWDHDTLTGRIVDFQDLRGFLANYAP